MPESRGLVTLAVVCVALLALIIVALVITWHQLQRNLIFDPVVGSTKPPLKTATATRLEQLDMWVVDRGTTNGPPAPVIIFFHGTFGNLEHSAPLIEILACFDSHVVAFDYSGYGASGGTPGTEQILSDGVLVYDFAKKRWPKSRLILWGHSLGTSVATFVASHLPCDALVLMSPFYALTEVGRDLGGVYHLASLFFSKLVNLLPTNEWIRRVSCPVAIVHSLKDPVISFRHALMLYDELLASRLGTTTKGRRPTAAEVRRTLLIIPTEGNHACTLISPEQMATLASFLRLGYQADACAELIAAVRRQPFCR